MGYIIKESVEELISSDESIEKNNKQKEYLAYINNHILNVQRIYVKFFFPCLRKYHQDSQSPIHDRHDQTYDTEHLSRLGHSCFTGP